MVKLLLCLALSMLTVSAASAKTLYWFAGELDGKHATTILLYDIPALSQQCKGNVAASVISDSTGTNVHEGCWALVPKGVQITYKKGGDVVMIPMGDLRALQVSR